MDAPLPDDATVVVNSSRQRLGRIVLAVLAVALAAVVVLAVLLGGQPAFYREAMAEVGPDGEIRARRLVTKASALHAAATRPSVSAVGDAPPGRWEAAIRADEINAWLAIDLPRSHADWLPRGVSAPRLAFRGRHATAGVRLGYGRLSTVAWADVEVVLRDVNEVWVAVQQARLGWIPLPRAAVMRELARRLDRLGMPTDLRRMDGRLVLVVRVPASRDGGATVQRIEMLSLADGELLVAGTTRADAGQGVDARVPP